jgi:hypothetical protein
LPVQSNQRVNGDERADGESAKEKEALHEMDLLLWAAYRGGRLAPPQGDGFAAPPIRFPDGGSAP